MLHIADPVQSGERTLAHSDLPLPIAHCNIVGSKHIEWDLVVVFTLLFRVHLKGKNCLYGTISLAAVFRVCFCFQGDDWENWE